MLTYKILLIDDVPEELYIFCSTVSTIDKSIDCVQAFNCKEGFHKLELSEGLPRYIFLDLNMPTSHGGYCMEKIKRHPTYSIIPVFVYTTSTRQVDIDESQKLGSQMFITKPDTEKELKKYYLM